MKVTVLGAGSFGTAVAQMLKDNNHDVKIWSIEEDVNNDINQNNANQKYGFSKLDSSITATSSIKEAVEFSNIILNVIPTAFIRMTFEKINEVISEKKIFVNFSKGIEPDTLLFIGDIIEQTIDSKYRQSFVDVSGPSHAELIAKRELTALSVASKNVEDANLISDLISTDYIKTSVSSDVVGLEYVSSCKNVIALGTGILNGLGHGENIRSAFIALGLGEIIKVSKVFDCEQSTIIGYGGVGDLIVTATSTNSRNFTFGTLIGQGKTFEESKEITKQIAEGVRSLDSMYQIGQKYNISLPIVEIMYEIIYNNLDPNEITKVF